ncbi:hypothetical protein, partial [Mesorhizobium sp. M2E.F.Ca.ET.154.01.1.1]|uniref:hypothetical protein n=1 Tax=Mesorhizobium sp. M2E.F.Ca.ET.154.01.1.1 TaxID=2500521 RepID=UPI001AEE627A
RPLRLLALQLFGLIASLAGAALLNARLAILGLAGRLAALALAQNVLLAVQQRGFAWLGGGFALGRGFALRRRGLLAGRRLFAGRGLFSGHRLLGSRLLLAERLAP